MRKYILIITIVLSCNIIYGQISTEEDPISFEHDTTIIGKNPQKEKKISYSFINEYGFQVAMPFEKRHFVTGDLIGVFVNYRHYFSSETNIKPLVNVALGTKINIFGEPDLYNTIAGGFKVKAFSFTAGICVETWGAGVFGGIEIKMGFTF
jgi:hypothetical protein